MIAADLSVEIEALLSEKIDTVPEMRRSLREFGQSRVRFRSGGIVESGTV